MVVSTSLHLLEKANVSAHSVVFDQRELGQLWKKLWITQERMMLDSGLQLTLLLKVRMMGKLRNPAVASSATKKKNYIQVSLEESQTVLTPGVAVVKSGNHLALVLRIGAVDSGKDIAHGCHVEFVVRIQQFVFIENTFGPTETGHHLIHSEVLHGFLLGRR